MRNLDHFVIPVASLAPARARYTALGFNVAPNASHPFGTENCCLFFADSTFIEPLAIGNLAVYENAADAGNMLVAKHRDYTNNVSPEGWSHLVVKSDNARADHLAFIQAGISAGEIVDFSRKFTKLDGSDGEVAFSLAFAQAPNSPFANFFACQVVKAVSGGRGALVNHPNGALGTIACVVSAEKPTEYDQFMRQFLNAEGDEIDSGISYQTKTGAVEIITADGCSAKYGFTPFSMEGMMLVALVLQVADLNITRALLAKNNIKVDDSQKRIEVAPFASGQGVTLIFQE